MLAWTRTNAAIAAGALIAGGVVYAQSASALPPGCAQSGATVTCTYNAGAATTFVVPSRVTTLTGTAAGGAGGTSTIGGAFGLGALISGTITVTPGQAIAIKVGGNGGPGSGGANGGGPAASASGCAPGGGGGRTEIGSLIVAGGGGGAGCAIGSSTTPGAGGNAGQAGGAGASPVGGAGTGGQSGAAGGAGGGSVCGGPGGMGNGLAGGAGGNCGAANGGGGGAGVIGGGGGGAGPLLFDFGTFSSVGAGGGGGGGWSSINTSSVHSVFQGFDSTRSPRVVLSYVVTSITGPAAADFGTVVVGGTTPTQSLTFTAHDGPVTISTLSFGGANADDFAAVSDGCSGHTLADSQSCTVQVAMTPSAAGARSATLTLNSTAVAGDATVALSGDGHAKTGALLIHGTGSTFTGTNNLVTVGVAAGTAAQYTLKIVNKSSVQAQFLVKVSTPTGNPANADLFTGSLSVKPLATGPDGWATNALNPGGSQSVVLKVTPNSSDGEGSSAVTVSISAMDRVQVDQVFTETNVKAPTKGSTQYDLFATSSGQPAIGGSFSGQTTTAPAITPTQTATFSVKLMNDSTQAAKIGLHVFTDSCSGAFTIAVKDGSTVVTAAALAGTYRTPTLNGGAARTITVTVKRTTAASACTSTKLKALSLTSLGADGFFSFLNTNLVAS